MYYFYSVLCKRIRHNCCCCCFWLIIQIMHSPANRVFPFSKCGGGGPILIMCTQCTHPSTDWNKHFVHATYFRCYNNYSYDKENDNYKVMFILSPNVLLLFILKIALWNVFFFLRNSVLYIWLSNEGIKHSFHLSLNYWKLNFLANKGDLLLKLKHGRMFCDHSLKN